MKNINQGEDVGILINIIKSLVVLSTILMIVVTMLVATLTVVAVRELKHSIPDDSDCINFCRRD